VQGHSTTDDRKFFNLEEAAPLVGLKPPTLRRAIRQGRLPYSKPGRAYLVRQADVELWLESEMRKGGVPLQSRRRAA